jgi:hypothetical protein
LDPPLLELASVSSSTTGSLTVILDSYVPVPTIATIWKAILLPTVEQVLFVHPTSYDCTTTACTTPFFGGTPITDDNN